MPFSRSLFKKVRRMAARSLRPPVLSVVVVVFRMPEQAEKTLHSLTPEYQKDVNRNDYEVIVVENASDSMLGEEVCGCLGRNFHYHLRREQTGSPVAALNYGVQQARGRVVALMIDGARMLTPGVIRYTLMACRLDEHPVISTPGYHLGRQLQQVAVDSGYDEKTETELLGNIRWPEDGYRLFDIACFSGTSAGGFFNPIGESNYIGLSKKMYGEMGGFDTRFDLPGGGFANLDFYKRACEHPGATLFILPGEGSFHQFHGGVTTGRSREHLQKDVIPELSAQYRKIRGQAYAPPRKKAIYLGTIPDNAQKFVRHSSERAIERHAG